jgi:hypothetical protein
MSLLQLCLLLLCCSWALFSMKTGAVSLLIEVVESSISPVSVLTIVSNEEAVIFS